MKYFWLSLALLLVLSSTVFGGASYKTIPSNGDPEVRIHYFYQTACDDCPPALNFLKDLHEKDETIQIRAYDVDEDPENEELLANVRSQLGSNSVALPSIVVEDRIVEGFRRPEEKEPEIVAAVERAEVKADRRNVVEEAITAIEEDNAREELERDLGKTGQVEEANEENQNNEVNEDEKINEDRKESEIKEKSEMPLEVEPPKEENQDSDPQSQEEGPRYWYFLVAGLLFIVIVRIILGAGRKQ